MPRTIRRFSSATDALVWHRRAEAVFVPSPGFLALRLPRAISGHGHPVGPPESCCVSFGIALSEPMVSRGKHCVGGQTEP